ncbi:MAG TPA: hypothetical protein VLX32_14520 [Candidatus Acidoferrum sp.]|nr:hypothetical protein [Candidatus Acidoferrum sp.]
MANSICEGSRAIPGNIHNFLIATNLIEKSKQPLGFGQEAACEIGFYLKQGIIDAKTVVTDAPGEKIHELLLSGQPFENLQEFRCRGIQGVIKFSFKDLAALFPAKRFFAEVGNLAVNVQIEPLKVVQFIREGKHSSAEGGADFEWRGPGILVELADFVGGSVGVAAHGDFHELGGTAFEDALEGEFCRA